MELIEALVLIVLLIGGGMTLVALFAVLDTLFPRVVDRTQRAADAMPLRSFLVGVVNSLFLVAVAAAMSALAESAGAPVLAVPALVALVLLVAGLAFGLTGVVRLVGARLFPDRGPRQQVVNSSVTLILACLAPFVGWFGLLPLVGHLGLGAFILGFFQEPAPTPAQAPGSAATGSDEPAP